MHLLFIQGHLIPIMFLAKVVMSKNNDLWQKITKYGDRLQGLLQQ